MSDWNEKEPSQQPTAAQFDVEFLTPEQMERLWDAFLYWFESAPNSYMRRVRGRYWITFLVLRFTGAKIGEILRLDDTTDVDFRTREIRIPKSGSPSRRGSSRVIPTNRQVIGAIATYLAEFPQMRGKVFGLESSNFRRKFYRRAHEAQIPPQLSHPHILRHTRAIELIDAGVPLQTVRDFLGHSVIGHTARYLQIRQTRVSVRTLLIDKGVL